MKTYAWGTPAQRLIKNGKVMCPRCERNEAKIHAILGVLPCNVCNPPEEVSGSDYRHTPMDEGRKKDLAELRERYKSAGSKERKLIEKAARKIQNETSLQRSMRESLIRDMRNGRPDNMKDTHEYRDRRSQYSS